MAQPSPQAPELPKVLNKEEIEIGIKNQNSDNYNFLGISLSDRNSPDLNTIIDNKIKSYKGYKPTSSEEDKGFKNKLEKVETLFSSPENREIYNIAMNANLSHKNAKDLISNLSNANDRKAYIDDLKTTYPPVEYIDYLTKGEEKKIGEILSSIIMKKEVEGNFTEHEDLFKKLMAPKNYDNIEQFLHLGHHDLKSINEAVDIFKKKLEDAKMSAPPQVPDVVQAPAPPKAPADMPLPPGFIRSNEKRKPFLTRLWNFIKKIFTKNSSQPSAANVNKSKEQDLAANVNNSKEQDVAANVTAPTTTHANRFSQSKGLTYKEKVEQAAQDPQNNGISK